jgi:hypothetical protein
VTYVFFCFCAGREEAVLTGVGSTIEFYICRVRLLSRLGPGSDRTGARKFYSSALGVHRQEWGARARRQPQRTFQFSELSGLKFFGGTVPWNACVVAGKKITDCYRTSSMSSCFLSFLAGPTTGREKFSEEKGGGSWVIHRKGVRNVIRFH